MDKKDVLEIYREQFAFEVERKKEITAQAQIRFALVATGATMLVYMARNFDLNAPISLLAIFCISSLMSAIVFSVIVYKLIEVFWGNTYSYLPAMDTSEEYRKNIENSPSTTESFEEYLIDEYSSCAGDNRKTNSQRQGKLNSIVKWLKASIIPFLISGGTFLIFDLDASSSRRPVEVQLKGIQNFSCDMIKQQLKVIHDGQ